MIIEHKGKNYRVCNDTGMVEVWVPPGASRAMHMNPRPGYWRRLKRDGETAIAVRTMVINIREEAK